MFHTTMPLELGDLVPLSSFLAHLEEDTADSPLPRMPSLWDTLPTALRSELEHIHHGSDVAGGLLKGLASAIRHGADVCLHLAYGSSVVPLTVLPTKRLAHAPIDLTGPLGSGFRGMRVLNVERPLIALGDCVQPLNSEGNDRWVPLQPLTSAVAMRGDFGHLLPEIAGPAAYRFSPVVRTDNLDLEAQEQALVRDLLHNMSSLDVIAEKWSLSSERVARLLNAAYLQGGLILSRTHPQAIQGITLLGRVH